MQVHKEARAGRPCTIAKANCEGGVYRRALDAGVDFSTFMRMHHVLQCPADLQTLDSIRDMQKSSVRRWARMFCS